MIRLNVQQRAILADQLARNFPPVHFIERREFSDGFSKSYTKYSQDVSALVDAGLLSRKADLTYVYGTDAESIASALESVH